jgi:ABC-type lipoprotein release transport system permease subunit
MTYRRSFILRWSRRDRLAALVVAVTVAFLVGTALLVVAGGAQTATLAAEFDATGSATFVADPATAPDDALVLPIAAVDGPDGDRTIAVGVPSGTDRTFGNQGRTLERASGTTVGDINAAETHRLVGTDGDTTVSVESRRGSIVPDDWYVTAPATIDTLGVDGALVIGSDGLAESDGRVVPLRSALSFFTAGIGEALRLLAVLVGASGLLVAVTVYSVTRMSVLDRRQAIQVARATGGTPRTILGAFTARAALLAAVGTAAGYAVGVIVVAVAVNVAVAVGLPTSIDPRVTADVAFVVAPIVVVVPLIGAVAGAMAAWPAAHAPPARIDRRSESVLDVLSPRVLRPRVIVPTTATLVAFAVFALLFVAAAGVLLPTLGGGEAVVTEPGSTHPVSSQLPSGYVEAFESQGINASGEILLFGVVDDRAVPTRGVVYEDFATVSDATIVDGRPPAAPDEAVVGVGAARTLGLEPGDRLPLGGSTRIGVTRVTVVGTFDAPPPYSDHVLVSLETARHLSTVSEPRVNIIRGTSRPKPTGEGITVRGVSTDQPLTANESVAVTIRLVNEGVDPTTKTTRVTFAGQERRFDVSLAAAEETTETVVFDGVAPGDYRLEAGTETRTVSVGSADGRDSDDPRSTIRLREVPPTAPPGSTPTVRVLDEAGSPVANASITVADETVRTGADGRARITLPDVGDYEIRAESDNRTERASVTVSEEADRVMLTDLTISPTPVDILVRPTARLTLRNPWNEAVTHEVRLEGPSGARTRTVSLSPGEETTVTRQLERKPVGSYAVTATLDGRQTANQTYRVTGDGRIAAALATSGHSADSPFARALEVAFGNVQVLGATLVVLAGVMAVGATTASFADAVHARRETLGIRRATGASPLLILRLVLGDALRLGGLAAIVGTLLALGILWLLDTAGLLVVFGVRLLPGLSIPAVVGVTGAGLAVTLLGATVATLAMLRASPASLLAGRSEPDETEDFGRS